MPRMLRGDACHDKGEGGGESHRHENIRRSRTYPLCHHAGRQATLHLPPGRHLPARGTTVCSSPRLWIRTSGSAFGEGKPSSRAVGNAWSTAKSIPLNRSRYRSTRTGFCRSLMRTKISIFFAEGGGLYKSGELGIDYRDRVADRAARTRRCSGSAIRSASAFTGRRNSRTSSCSAHSIAVSTTPYKLPGIRGQLVDSTCVFGHDRVWFFTSKQEGNKAVNRCICWMRAGLCSATPRARRATEHGWGKSAAHRLREISCWFRPTMASCKLPRTAARLT